MAFPDKFQGPTFFPQYTNEKNINDIFKALLQVGQDNSNIELRDIAQMIIITNLTTNVSILDAFRTVFIANPPCLYKSSESCRNRRSKLHDALTLLTDEQLKAYLENKLETIQWVDYLSQHNLRVVAIAIKERQIISPDFKVDNLLDIWQKITQTDALYNKEAVQIFIDLYTNNDENKALDKVTKDIPERIRLKLRTDTSEAFKARAFQNFLVNAKRERQSSPQSDQSSRSKCTIM